MSITDNGCYTISGYVQPGYAECSNVPNSSSDCYVYPGYAVDGYFVCTVETETTPSTTNNSNKPVFKEDYKKSFRGAPSVKLGHTVQQKTPDKYDFVTSIIINSEQGEPNKPTFINTPKELLETFGTYINKDMKYCLSFLAYSPSLLVTRSMGIESYNSSTYDFPLIKINNFEEFTEYPEEDFLQEATVRFIAQTPGTEGNLLKVSLFTKEELDNNENIYKQYNAKDILNGMDSVCYCVAIFKDLDDGTAELKEMFVVPFNDLESINTQSKLVYCRLNAYNDFLDGFYDGNDYKYTGNLVFADGDAGRYYYGYDGNLELLDGNIGFYDGEEFNEITYIVKFYGGNIMKLGDGSTQIPTMYDLEETAEELDNKTNYNIDLHIGNNITLFRDDVVNIVGTPKGVEQAIDFKLIFDARRSTYQREKTKNTFFIYGVKLLDKEEINCSADYAGLRSRDILSHGLGRSTSKITTPLKINRLKTNPSLPEMDNLYQNGINIVNKSRNVVYCNGEIIHEDNL